jgi:hypothetical protein
MSRSVFDDAARVPELDAPHRASFQAEISRSSGPLVLRGVVAHWPLVQRGAQSPEAVVNYLSQFVSAELVDTVIAPATARGRLLYANDFTDLNHRHSTEKLTHVLKALLRQMDEAEPLGVSMQSLLAKEHFAGFERENGTDLVPQGTDARLWIGNAVTVAPHFDAADNLACVGAGRRRFILFPTDEVENLYVGPFHITPAGVPVSIVPLDDPDLSRWPRYKKAMAAALVADLAPGDAIYIPYLWWHGVQSLDSVNVLVNYWWHADAVAAEHPNGALLRACYAVFQSMPPEHRAAWRSLYDYFVFATAGGPLEHLPPTARSRTEISPQAARELKSAIAAFLK